MSKRLVRPSQLSTEHLFAFIHTVSVPSYEIDDNVRDRYMEYRTVVLDWMHNVAVMKKMYSGTVFVAKSYFDRYLTAVKKVRPVDLPLIGGACLVIATIEHDDTTVTSEYLVSKWGALFTSDQLDAKITEVKDALHDEYDTVDEVYVIMVCKELLNRGMTSLPDSTVIKMAYFLASMTLLVPLPSKYDAMQVGFAATMLALFSFGYDDHANYLCRLCSFPKPEMDTLCDQLRENWKTATRYGDEYYINRCWKANGFCFLCK